MRILGFKVGGSKPKPTRRGSRKSASPKKYYYGDAVSFDRGRVTIKAIGPSECYSISDKWRPLSRSSITRADAKRQIRQLTNGPLVHSAEFQALKIRFFKKCLWVMDRSNGQMRKVL